MVDVTFDAQELSLDLGGDLDRDLIILATDGLFGRPTVSSSSDLSVLVLPGAEMKQICQGVMEAVDQQAEFTTIGVMIVGGTSNFEMESQAVGGRMPINYLVNNWSKVKNKLQNSVINPLTQLNQQLAARGAKLLVASILPSQGTIQMKTPVYSELLQDSLKTVNRWIHQLNISNKMPHLFLAEQYSTRRSSARRSDFLAVYRHQNYRSLWNTCMKALYKLKSTL